MYAARATRREAFVFRTMRLSVICVLSVGTSAVPFWPPADRSLVLEAKEDGKAISAWGDVQTPSLERTGAESCHVYPVCSGRPCAANGDLVGHGTTRLYLDHMNPSGAGRRFQCRAAAGAGGPVINCMQGVVAVPTPPLPVPGGGAFTMTLVVEGSVEVVYARHGESFWNHHMRLLAVNDGCVRGSIALTLVPAHLRLHTAGHSTRTRHCTTRA